MKIKLFILSLICIFLGIVITKQDELIKVPRDERKLIRISEKILEGKVINFIDGDSFVLEGNIKIRLFGIDAPELNQTCLPNRDDGSSVVSETIVQNANLQSQSHVNTTQQQVTATQPPIIQAKNVDEKAQTQTNVQTTNTKAVNSNVEIIKCGEDAKNKLIKLVGDNKVTCLIKGKDAYERMVGECNFEAYNRRNKRKYKVNINKEMVLSGYAVAFQQISDKYIEDENKARQENAGIWATIFDFPSVYRNKNHQQN